jgi:hypothetical protein
MHWQAVMAAVAAKMTVEMTVVMVQWFVPVQ